MRNHGDGQIAERAKRLGLDKPGRGSLQGRELIAFISKANLE